MQSSLVPVASSRHAHTARAAQLVQLQELLHSSQQLADSLGLSELAQNQRFWQARIQQLQQQQQRPQQQEGTQPVWHQGAAPCACRNSDCSCGAAATAATAAAETSTQQHANTCLPPSGARAALCCSSAKQPGSGSTSRGTNKQPAAFKAQLPLTLARPMNPFDPGMPDVEMHYASKVPQQPPQQVPGTQQREQQRQQQQEPTHLCDDQQQTQQQQESAGHQHPQQEQQQQQHEQVDARVRVRRVATLLAAHSEKHAAQQQQQRAGRTQEPMSVDARPSGGFRSHHTSLLDALAVAAAVASEEASALEQSASAAFWPAAAAPTHAPPVLLEAASSSEQALLQAAHAQAAPPAAAGDNGSTRRRRSSSSSASAPLEPCTSTDKPATTVARVGGGGAAAAGGPARKSCLLELADQLGAAALATAQAAVEAGQPLTYGAVMQLLQPLETCVADVLGPPLQEVAEVKLDDVRRVSRRDSTA